MNRVTSEARLRDRAVKPERALERGRLAKEGSVNSAILFLYALSIVWPIRFQIGPAYMTFSRILIIVLLVPMIGRLLSGRYGGVKPIDYFIVFHCTWAYIAMSVNHGFLYVSEASVMYFVEITGAYLIGRIFIRNMADFKTFVKYLLTIILISVPFALVETQTDRSPILELLRSSNPAPDFFKLPGNVNYEARFGLQRSQFTMGHPINYGIFSASLLAFALTIHTQNKSLFPKGFWAGAVWLATIASVSSAAVLSALLQMGFLGFERVTRAIKKRWTILATIMIISYIVVEIISTKAPIALFASKFAFNPATARNRILIFEYGSAEVMRHPIFGIGNNDWVRAPWMVSSMDNHWLLKFMRYGFPGGLAITGAVLYCLTVVGRANTHGNESLAMAQRGFMIAMLGWCISLGTVAINVEVQSYFMTLLGAGLWIADTARRSDDVEHEERFGRRRATGRRSLPRNANKNKEDDKPARGNRVARPDRGKRSQPVRASRSRAERK